MAFRTGCNSRRRHKYDGSDSTASGRRFSTAVGDAQQTAIRQSVTASHVRAAQSSKNRARAGSAGRVRVRRSTSERGYRVERSSDATRQFRIDFRAERIVVANGVQDALLQTLLAGATYLTAIVQS